MRSEPRRLLQPGGQKSPVAVFAVVHTAERHGNHGGVITADFITAKQRNVADTVRKEKRRHSKQTKRRPARLFPPTSLLLANVEVAGLLDERAIDRLGVLIGHVDGVVHRQKLLVGHTHGLGLRVELGLDAGQGINKASLQMWFFVLFFCPSAIQTQRYEGYAN